MNSGLSMLRVLSGCPGGWHLGSSVLYAPGEKERNCCAPGRFPSFQSIFLYSGPLQNLILQPASPTRNQGHLQRLPFLHPPSQHQPTKTGSIQQRILLGTGNWFFLAWLPTESSSLMHYFPTCNIALGLITKPLPDGRIWFLVPTAEGSAVQRGLHTVEEKCA